MEKKNLIADMTFDFALQIISLHQYLQGHKEYALSKQLLRSGTSIGANVEEAVAGYSRKDFANKLSIACKEARETRYWLRLLDKSQVVKSDYSQHLLTIQSIVNVLTKIIKTTKENSTPKSKNL